MTDDKRLKRIEDKLDRLLEILDSERLENEALGIFKNVRNAPATTSELMGDRWPLSDAMRRSGSEGRYVMNNAGELEMLGTVSLDEDDSVQ